MPNFLTLCLRITTSIILVGSLAIAKDKLEAPTAFVANCQACHILDQTVVGPSLVEIAELYPKVKQAEFIQWCVDPGKKRDQMPQMPSMAHIPVEELTQIHQYILDISVGVRRIKTSNKDPFVNTPNNTLRPRVQRTFVEDSGPASIIISLPTELKHNVIWDTDQCRLRYITVGEIDNWPYLKSNGNSLAKVGETVYKEKQLFENIEANPQFKGYSIDEANIPTFYYELKNQTISEKIYINDAQEIVRLFTAEKALPEINLRSAKNGELKATTKIINKQLKITYK